MKTRSQLCSATGPSRAGWFALLALALAIVMTARPSAAFCASKPNQTTTQKSESKADAKKSDKKDQKSSSQKDVKNQDKKNKLDPKLIEARKKALQSVKKATTPNAHPTTKPAKNLNVQKGSKKAPHRMARPTGIHRRKTAIKPQTRPAQPAAHPKLPGRPTIQTPKRPTAKPRPGGVPHPAVKQTSSTKVLRPHPTPNQPSPAKPQPKQSVPQANPSADNTNATPAPMADTHTTIIFRTESPNPERRTYKFSYVDTPWSDVLSDFSRVSALPLVNMPDIPMPGKLTYQSTGEFTFIEALHKLNDLLFERPLNNYIIQRQGDYLTVDKLPDLIRKIPPAKMFNTFEEFQAAHLDPYDVCLTQFEVPSGWTPFDIIEQFRTKFSDTYGTQVSGETTIELTGLTKEHHLFKQIVGKLTKENQPHRDDSRPRIMIHLKAAKASDVQTLLRQLYPISGVGMNRRGKRAPRVTLDPSLQQAKQLIVVPDTKNNIIYAKGPQYLLDQVRQTVTNVDVGRWTPPKQEIIPLKHASALAVVKVLKPLLQKQTNEMTKSQLWIPPEMKNTLTCDIFANTSGNGVILFGGSEGVDRARRLVEQYDVSPDWVNEIIEVKHADARELAAEIQNNLPPAPQGTTLPQITPRSSKLLLVSCSKQDYQKILELLTKLDVPDAETPRQHFVHLKHARPSNVAQKLPQLLEGAPATANRNLAARRRPQANKRRPRPRPRPRQPNATVSAKGIIYVPDDQAGTLIVFCSDRDWKKVEPLIEELDNLAQSVQPIMHSVQLKNADAADVAAMINEMYPPPAGPQSQDRAKQIVTADTYNNTITLFAKPDFIDQVLPLIERLDIVTTSETTIIRLVNCQAEDIAPILSQTFPGSQLVTPNRSKPIQRRKGARIQRPSINRATGQSSIRIVAEPITNSLLVNAPPKELNQIKNLVADMEKESEKYRPDRVILIAENRPAAEIADTLQSLLGSGAAARRITRGKPGSAAARASRKTIKILAIGDRIVLDGPQDKIAEAIQLVNRIDVYDQQPISRKIRVLDAEEDETKLRTLLAMRTPQKAVARKGRKPGLANKRRTAVAPSDIRIYADTYENTLLIRAMPKDFVIIDELLNLILTEADVPEPLKGRPEEETFFLAKLHYKKALDLDFMLDDLINTDERSNVRFTEGPDEKTLLVRNYRPAQKEMIQRFIAMYDVPSSGSIGGMQFVDLEDKMPAAQILLLMKKVYRSPSGRQIQFLDSSGTGGRVQVINIHADEPADHATDESKPPEGRSVQPCVLPACLLAALHAITIAAASDDEPPVHRSTSPAVCPICHQSPCVLPAKLMLSLDSLVLASQQVAAEKLFQHQQEPRNQEEPRASARAALVMANNQTASKSDPRDARTSQTHKKARSASPKLRHNHTIRQVALRSAQPQLPPTAADQSDQVTVMVDPDTGKLVIIGPEEERRAIEDWIDEVTKGKSPPVIRVFPMKYADVNNAAKLLNQVFNQQQATVARPQQRGVQQPGAKGQPQAGRKGAKPGQQAGRPPMRPVAKAKARIRVVPDDRTRSLYVVAPLSDIPLIVDVLRKIDSRMIDKGQNIKIFRLKNLEAEQVAETLRLTLGIQTAPTPRQGRPGRQNRGQTPQQLAQQMLQMQGRQGSGTLVTAEKIQLTAETQTNTIIAKAPPDTLELIGTLIEDLEKETNNTEVDMRRLQLKHARATEIAPIVSELAKATAPATRSARGRTGAAARGARNATGVSVNADPRTNSLILAGRSKDLDRVTELVKDLDNASGEGSSIRQFPVRGDPKTTAETLKKLFASEGKKSDIVITANQETSTVVVKAPSAQMAEIEQQIGELDAKVVSVKELRTIKLMIADAETVAEKLTDVFSASKGSGSGKQKLNIRGVKSNNTLYVQCTDEMFPQIQDIAHDMDKAPSDVQVKRFPLKYASAEETHQKLKEMLTQAAATGGMGDMKLDLVGAAADPRTNSLIITGGPKTMALMNLMLAAVDVPAEGNLKREQHVLEVANTNPQDVANSLQQIFDARIKGQKGRTTPTIRAIPGTTKLFVDANTEEFQQIKSLVNKVDIEGGRMVHTVTIPEEVPAKSVADNINKLYGGGSRKDGIRAESHDPTNTLLVYATEAEFEKIDQQVIQKISEMDPVAALKFYKIHLKYTVADQQAKILQDFFDKKAGVNKRSAFGGFFGGNRSTNKERENQVTVMAEPNSNMLLIYATESTKALIDDYLKEVDVDLAGDRDVKVVTIQHMDVADMVDILTEALKVSQHAKEENRPAYVPSWYQKTTGGGDKKVVLAGDTRLKAIESMNAVLVAGRKEAVARAVKKIGELDVPGHGAEQPKMYSFQHATAGDISDILTKTFINSKASAGRAGSSGKSKLTIVPVDATNSIVVKGKPSDVSDVLAMAQTLDDEMKDEPAGVRLLPVPSGINAEDLAQLIQGQMNDAENNKKKLMKDYRPNLVSIAADRRANVLLVSGSKGQFEAVKQLVGKMVAMGPAGGRVTKVIRLKNISADQVQKLIDQLHQNQKGGRQGGSQRGSRGRAGGNRSRRRGRSDAGWTHTRHDDGLEHPSLLEVKLCAKCTRFPRKKFMFSRDPKGSAFQPPFGSGLRRVRKGEVMFTRGTFSASMPILVMQVMLGTAIAQTSSEKPHADNKAPRIGRIRPRRPTTQPARRNTPTSSRKSPALHPRPGKRMTPRQKINTATQPAGLSNWSPAAQRAAGKRLSGGEINVAQAGADGVIIDASEEDMQVIQALIKMLDTAVPQKNIEYVHLKNAQAKNLAKTLSDVFKNIEKKGDRPVLPQDQVNIIADARTNGLYIAATEDKMQQALDLIHKNDNPQDFQRSFKAFFFKNRRVTEAGDVLKKLATSFLKQKGLDPSLISIEIDPQNNSVFVTAGETYLQFIEKMVETLDVELPATEKGKGGVGQADIMVVPLRVAKADALATLLSELLTKAATGDTPMKDFIRRLRLLDEKGQPIAEVNLDRPIFIFGEPDSNALIIASTLENCLIMKQVALAFDKEPAKSPVSSKVFSLQYADATEVADKINQLLTDSEALTQRPGKTDKSGVPDGKAGSLVYAAAISADARTNQVVVVGRPAAVEVLTGLIKRLDVKGRGVMPFDIVKLEFASSTGLASALTEMMDKRKEALPSGGENAQKSETVIITADPRSQSLIIAAKRERMEELKELIKKLDVRAAALIENIRTITLRKGNASDLATKLQDLWTQTQNQRGGDAGGFKLEVPAIVADERSNSLIVSASKSDFQAIKAVVDKIEALKLNPMANIYIVRLKHNSAMQLSSALQTLFDKRSEMRTVDGKSRPEDKVSIEVDEVTNALLVAASRENYEVLQQKVAELDVEIGVMGQVQFFVCTNVTAMRVKDTIDALFQEGPFKPGGTGESNVSQKREKVTTMVDERSNVLIASASPENMKIVRKIFKRMNSVVTPWDVAITKMISLKYADCIQVAAQLEDFFQGIDDAVSTGDNANRKSLFAIKTFTDPGSNRIIVGGTKDGIDRAVALIKKLDVPPDSPTQAIKVYRLKEAPAQRIGDVITNVFQERNQPRQGATGTQVPNITVTVEVDEKGNALVINASRFEHTMIAELIAQLDRPTSMLSMVKVFPLTKSTPAKIKEILDEAYQVSGGGAGGGAPLISVIEDERTNAVVVAAPPGELSNIDTLIKRLDSVEVTDAAEVGIFQCENEDASKMTDLLNEIMTGQPAQGGAAAAGQQEETRPMSSMLMTYRLKDAEGAEKLLQSLRENVQITFNERTNSVIAVAPPSSLKLIEQLVRKLDKIQKRPVLVKVFLLHHADAPRMVDLLTSMFAQDQGNQQQQEFQQGREVTVEGGISQTGGLPTEASQEGPTQKGTFGRPRTTFVADERTNAVIVAGWPEDIDVVADVIDQLDSRDIQARDTFVYSLVNMKADDMQTALDSYFQGEAQRLDQIDALSPQQRMERDVSVVAHEESNQLIVATSPRFRSEVMRIIEELDRPPPQVMIQVLIAEVTLDDRFEMGLEFALQQLRFSETAAAGPNGVLSSNHFDVVGGTDLGAAGSGLGGFSFTITGEDFNFLVRALQVDSRLEVIQRPMIVIQNNQEGNIIVGQNVPFLRGTQVTDNGQVNSQVEFEDIGIQLTVTPNINPDGFVYMEVHPQISALTQSTLDIGNGVLAPIFTNREAETTVVAKDGETIVIAGLITTTDNESESKVPLLGDLPGIGNLFRSTTRTETKTELLIALTPRIMRTVEDGRRISIEERDKAGIITDKMKQSPLFEGLQTHPESADEISSIEAVPAQAEPSPMDQNARPIQIKPKVHPKKRYGPRAPRYGPRIPSKKQVIARRNNFAVQTASLSER